jgi:hypothetical protein
MGKETDPVSQARDRAVAEVPFPRQEDHDPLNGFCSAGECGHAPEGYDDSPYDGEFARGD